jgi:cytosine/adenosine deaminase-related metal-dependent hydrolase
MNIEGTILVGSELEPIEGRIVVENQEIVAVEETDTDSANIVLPAFVNAHTHIGDSIAKEAAIGLDVDEAVAPPDSVKHQLLRAASDEQLISGMRDSMAYMEETGTAAFMDFREFGVEGARRLREAAQPQDVREFIFGSDNAAVLDIADGFGASGANDDEFAERREATRKAGQPFAIHAGEPNDSDIHPALDLDPELLIHMVHAEQEHLDRVQQQEVPIVICPRANVVLDSGFAPVRELVDHTTVAIGTDNVMLNNPNMFREMEFAAKLFDVSPREVLRMATVAGAEVAGFDFGVIEAGAPAKVVVIDGDSNNLSSQENVHATITRRAGPEDIKRVLL